MSRAAARLNHPSLRDGRATSERAPVPASYAAVREAYEELEEALEMGDPAATSVAASEWWIARQRLREACIEAGA